MKKLSYIACTILVTANLLVGQEGNSSVTVSISATVKDFIEMITLADIDVGTVIPSEETLTLDPRNDQGAGIIMLKGANNESVQVSFSTQVVMINLATRNTLAVNYSVSGNTDNQQSSSKVFTTNPVTVILNSKGEYFLYIGCSFSLKDLDSGQYDGDFVIEVESN